jgi:hypothetical protein
VCGSPSSHPSLAEVDVWLGQGGKGVPLRVDALPVDLAPEVITAKPLPLDKKVGEGGVLRTFGRLSR